MHLRLALAGTLLLLAHGSRPAAARQVSDEEFRTFAEGIAAGIMDGNAGALDDHVDVDATLERALEGVDLSERDMAEMLESLKKGLGARPTIGTNLVGAVDEGGLFKFLRLRTIDGRPRALFRLTFEEGGLDYFELELREMEGGIRVVDGLDFLIGEWTSQSIRRFALPIIEEKHAGVLARLSGEVIVWVLHARKIGRMNEAFFASDHSTAYDLYLKLPLELQKDRNLLVRRFAIAANLGEEEYAETLAFIEEAHPEDPTLQFMLIDHYLNTEQHDKAIRAIARTGQAIGGDAYLDYLEGEVLLDQDKVDEARSAFRRAIEAEPTLDDPYWGLLTVSLLERDHGEAARLLELLEVDFDYDFDDLDEDPDFAEFVKSEAYRKWHQARAGR